MQPKTVSADETSGDNSAGDSKPTRLPGDADAENEAIRRAQDGDAEAFEFLYKMHNRRVYALCLRMTSNPIEAQDLMQDAFLQVFRKIKSFRGESSFSTWLHRLTVNIILMRFRRKRHPEVSLDEPLNGDEESLTFRSELGGPDLQIHGTLDRLRLDRAIAELPSGYKSIFVLHDVQGYAHEEIAAILGCSIGNSKSQLHKARLRMRELLTRRIRRIKRRKATSKTGNSLPAPRRSSPLLSTT
jgi:RNA polymerase sigma-70 factor, ECF subfamily